jgi:hypothetical protein
MFGNEIIPPSVLAPPAISLFKAALCNGICNVQDDMPQLYTGLNYFEVLGMVSLDGATVYLPSLTAAYIQYFASISPAIQIYRPSEVISVQFLLVDGLVVSRVYYQVYANTPQPFNSFNYQIKFTRFNPVFGMALPGAAQRLGGVTSNNGSKLARTDLLTRARQSSDGLVMAWLPHFAVQVAASHSDIALDKKLAIENVLIKFWQKSSVFNIIFYIYILRF